MTKNDMCGFQKQGQKANYVYEDYRKKVFLGCVDAIAYLCTRMNNFQFIILP